MNSGFKNKLVVITGASTGIGRAISVEFAKAGATVMLTSRNKIKLEETVQMVKNVGGGISAAVLTRGSTAAKNSTHPNVKNFC